MTSVRHDTQEKFNFQVFANNKADSIAICLPRDAVYQPELADSV